MEVFLVISIFISGMIIDGVKPEPVREERYEKK